MTEQYTTWALYLSGDKQVACDALRSGSGNALCHAALIPVVIRTIDSAKAVEKSIENCGFC